MGIVLGKKVFSSNLILMGNKKNLKNSTYDLTIGRIIPTEDASSKEIKFDRSFPKVVHLMPRQMAWVVSKEKFQLPNNITGLATLRATLTRQGILGLNVGVIDPGHHGHISSILINFSDRPRSIREGDKFFRVLFFEHEEIHNLQNSPKNSESDVKYFLEVEDRAATEFPSSFLNIPNLDEKFYDEFVGKLIVAALKRYWLRLLIGFFILFFATFEIFTSSRNVVMTQNTIESPVAETSK